MSDHGDATLSRIHVKNLRLRTFIGFNNDEQRKRQDVVVNVRLDYDAVAAAREDAVARALDYRTLTKEIIAHVEENRFLLLERLVYDVLQIALAPASVRYAEVEVDKPHALRFADSVSLTMGAWRDEGDPTPALKRSAGANPE